MKNVVTSPLTALCLVILLIAGAAVFVLNSLPKPVIDDENEAWRTFEGFVVNAEVLKDIAIKPHYELSENSFADIEIELLAMVADGFGAYWLAAEITANDFNYNADEFYYIVTNFNYAGEHQPKIVFNESGKAILFAFVYREQFLEEDEIDIQFYRIYGENIEVEGYMNFIIKNDFPECPVYISNNEFVINDEIIINKITVTPFSICVEYAENAPAYTPDYEVDIIFSVNEFNFTSAPWHESYYGIIWMFKHAVSDEKDYGTFRYYADQINNRVIDESELAIDVKSIINVNIKEHYIEPPIIITTDPQIIIPITKPVNLNTDIFADLGLTYTQMKEKYGEPVDSGVRWKTGYWAEFENGLTYVFDNLDRDINYENPAPLKDEAVCQSINISMEGMFPELPLPVIASDLTSALENEFPIKRSNTICDGYDGAYRTTLIYEDIVIYIRSYTPPTKELKINCFSHGAKECGCIYNCEPLDYVLAEYVVFDTNSSISVYRPGVPGVSVNQISKEIGSDNLIDMWFYLVEKAEEMEVICWTANGEFRPYPDNGVPFDLPAHRSELINWLSSLEIREGSGQNIIDEPERWEFIIGGFKFYYNIAIAESDGRRFALVYAESPYNILTDEGGQAEWYLADIIEIPDFLRSGL